MLSIAEQLTRLVTILRAAIGIQVDRQLRPPQHVWLGAKLYLPLIAAQKRPPLWSGPLGPDRVASVN